MKKWTAAVVGEKAKLWLQNNAGLAGSGGKHGRGKKRKDAGGGRFLLMIVSHPVIAGLVLSWSWHWSWS